MEMRVKPTAALCNYIHLTCKARIRRTVFSQEKEENMQSKFGGEEIPRSRTQGAVLRASF